MPKNSPPPICPKCSMPMRFVLVKTGGRKFRCVDCDVTDLLNLPEVTKHSHGRIKSSGLNCFRWLWRWSSGYTQSIRRGARIVSLSGSNKRSLVPGLL
jgi:hypothetical protein